MSNKLVYISGMPFWMTPEGRFEAVEMKNGLPVERIVMKKQSDSFNEGPHQLSFEQTHLKKEFSAQVQKGKQIYNRY